MRETLVSAFHPKQTSNGFLCPTGRLLWFVRVMSGTNPTDTKPTVTLASALLARWTVTLAALGHGATASRPGLQSGGSGRTPPFHSVRVTRPQACRGQAEDVSQAQACRGQAEDVSQAQAANLGTAL